nr:hypothetical protein [Corynebacterium lactis]
MNRNVDYFARPSYEDYIRGLGEVDLRFLLDRSWPSILGPRPEGDEAVHLLQSEAASTMVLSFCDPDVLDVAQMIHALEDSATVESLLSVAFWASEADTAAHDGPDGVDRQRRRVGKRELQELLERGQRQGLVWEEPAGVWNVPKHISERFPAEPTLDFSVLDLVHNSDLGALERRMDRLGIDDLDEREAAREAFADKAGEEPGGSSESRAQSEVESLMFSRAVSIARSYLCDPVRVRSVVASAPVDIRNELRWMVLDDKSIPLDQWSEQREDAVRWAEERLLLCVAPLDPDSAVYSFAPREDSEPLVARFAAPAALALKDKGWFIRRPHRTEPYPGSIEPQELTEASVAAVTFASAFMEAAGSNDGRLKDPLDIYEQSSLLWIQDFAASVGADAFAAPWIVEMLVNAGLLDPQTGHPTPRALESWYSADATAKWGYLVAGFLAGRGQWSGEYPWATADAGEYAAAALAYGYPRAAREVVSLAAQLEEDQKYYGCCVENHLLWRVENLCLRNGADPDSMISWLLEQAGILGILYQGQSSWQAMSIMYALHDAWLTDQYVSVPRMAELIAEYASGHIPAAEAVQISKLLTDSTPNERLSATLDGVPGNAVSMALDFIGDRETCGKSSRWIISEDSLRRACLAVDGDVDGLFVQLGPLLNSSMKLVIYAELLRLTKTEKLYKMLEHEAPEPSSLADAPADVPAAENGQGQSDDEGPDAPEGPEQLSLF